MRPTRMTRLLRLEAEDPDTGWERGHGLSSLLKRAARWERDDPDWEPTDQELEARALQGDGMAGLLLEARRALQEGGNHGA